MMSLGMMHSCGGEKECYGKPKRSQRCFQPQVSLPALTVRMIPQKLQNRGSGPVLGERNAAAAPTAFSPRSSNPRKPRSRPAIPAIPPNPSCWALLTPPAPPRLALQRAAPHRKSRCSAAAASAVRPSQAFASTAPSAMTSAATTAPSPSATSSPPTPKSPNPRGSQARAFRGEKARAACG